MINMMKQSLGHRTPQQEAVPRGKNFQELKICDHGTVLVLYVFLKGLKEPR